MNKLKLKLNLLAAAICCISGIRAASSLVLRHPVITYIVQAATAFPGQYAALVEQAPLQENMSSLGEQTPMFVVTQFPAPVTATLAELMGLPLGQRPVLLFDGRPVALQPGQFCMSIESDSLPLTSIPSSAVELVDQSGAPLTAHLVRPRISVSREVPPPQVQFMNEENQPVGDVCLRLPNGDIVPVEFLATAPSGCQLLQDKCMLCLPVCANVTTLVCGMALCCTVTTGYTMCFCPCLLPCCLR